MKYEIKFVPIFEIIMYQHKLCLKQANVLIRYVLCYVHHLTCPIQISFIIYQHFYEQSQFYFCFVVLYLICFLRLILFCVYLVIISKRFNVTLTVQWLAKKFCQVDFSCFKIKYRNMTLFRKRHSFLISYVLVTSY